MITPRLITSQTVTPSIDKYHSNRFFDNYNYNYISNYTLRYLRSPQDEQAFYIHYEIFFIFEVLLVTL